MTFPKGIASSEGEECKDYDYNFAAKGKPESELLSLLKEIKTKIKSHKKGISR